MGTIIDNDNFDELKESIRTPIKPKYDTSKEVY